MTAENLLPRRELAELLRRASMRPRPMTAENAPAPTPPPAPVALQ